MDKVDFDGINKYITVKTGVTTLDIRTDVYSAFIRWTAMPNVENYKYLYAIRYTGLDPIPGGFTGDTYFLINGWKLILDPTIVRITGILFSDNYETPYYMPNLSPFYPVSVSSLVNTVTISQNVITGDAATIATQVGNLTSAITAVPQAVRTVLNPELTKITNQVDGLTPTQLTMLQEIYRMYGLDPSRPLIVTPTTRTAGNEIHQNIVSDSNHTAITRA